MNVDDIRTLYAFNRWATTRLIEAARRLSLAEFTKDLGTSYGSVKGTFVHMLWAEWIWLQRWRGDSPKHVFAPDEVADLDAISARWTEVAAGQRELTAALTDDRLQARLSYENLQGQRWEYSIVHMMQHVVNHSTYHRGQIVSLLRQLGQKPPPTDFLVFFDEGGREDWTRSEP